MQCPRTFAKRMLTESASALDRRPRLFLAGVSLSALVLLGALVTAAATLLG